LKWKYNLGVAIISKFSNIEMTKINIKDVDIVTPRCVWKYNVALSGWHLKDQNLQPY
jgi:hypothetical protein